MSVQFAEPHRFTVEQFHRMAETGILSPDDRVELINGEIIEMTPMGPRHASRTRAIHQKLERLLGNDAVVSMQLPVSLGFAEPYPDISVARWREDLYEEAHPTPQDVRLIIEVADSTVLYDRNVKSATYAQAGIPEFWVVDLPHDIVVVFTSPEAGRYTEMRDYRRGESWTSPGLGGREVKTEDWLGAIARG